jgi:tetratricopeptide (TPR) repeat protein
MSNRNISPLELARAHMHAGEKALKKSYLSLKFSADYTTAASEFMEAAQLFSQAGQKAEAVDAWTQSGEARLKEHDHFSAARCFESAGDLNRAAECYQTAGKQDAAVRVWLKQGESDGSQSIAAYERVIEMYTVQDPGKAILAVDVFRSYLSKVGSDNPTQYLEVSARFAEVLKSVGQLPFVYKEVASQVIVALAQGDTVKAGAILDKAMELDGIMRSGEYSLAHDLYEAMRSHDAEALESVRKRQVLTFLRPEIVRQAKSLRVVGQPAGEADTTQDDSELLR